MDQDKAEQIFKIGKDLEELLDHPGFNHILDNYVEKGLDRQRFLGCRPGKLMWMQGFQAALDGLLKFIDHGIREKDKVVLDAESAQQ